MSYVRIDPNYKRGGYLHAHDLLQKNLSGSTLKKAFRLTWKSIEGELERGYRPAVPMRAKPYPPSHYNHYRYRRNPGDARRSVKSFQAKRVPRNKVPRAYMRIEAYPYPFLIRGTKERETKDGRKTGQIKSRMLVQPFYSVKAPAAINRALRVLFTHPNIARPLG